MKYSNSVVKLLVAALVIFIAAAGGMYLGGKLGIKSGNASAQQEDVFTNLTLGPGVEFPEIELIDSKYLPVMSKVLLNENGTVVLFIDDDCPPCGEIAADWQKRIDEGAIASKQVVGICFANAAQIHSIHDKYQVDFPIYADERYVFLDYYGVDAFPLILVVNGSGVITYVESDSNKKLGKEELNRLLKS